MEANTHPSAVDTKIKKERDLGRIARPFEEPSFQDLSTALYPSEKTSEAGTYCCITGPILMNPPP